MVVTAICTNCYDKPVIVHLPDRIASQQNPRLPGGGFLLSHTNSLNVKMKPAIIALLSFVRKSPKFKERGGT